MCCEQSELEVLQQIYSLTDAKQNWRKLLALGNTLDQQLKRKLLWIWPTVSDIKKFNQKLQQLGLQTVLSIGCGSGLLEWLITAAGENTVRVYGLERDPNWWRSKYAVRSFIPLNYVENTGSTTDSILNSSIFSRCCSGAMPCALLFCYFNNHSAFVDYLSVFEGTWVVLIGPHPNLGIHTNPNPLQPELSSNEWELHTIINWTEQNVVAIYKKLE